MSHERSCNCLGCIPPFYKREGGLSGDGAFLIAVAVLALAACLFG